VAVDVELDVELVLLPAGAAPPPYCAMAAGTRASRAREENILLDGYIGYIGYIGWYERD